MNNKFKYIKSHDKVKPNGIYRVANKKDIKDLEKYQDNIKNSSEFYKDKLADKNFSYVYKEANQLKEITLKYPKVNFPHLTGIDFSYVSADKKFENLNKGTNDSPVLIERRNRTQRKLEVIKYLPDLLKCDSVLLTSLDNSNQAKRIGINKAIKNGKHNLLIGLKDFEPKIYSPKTLLNLKGSHEYDDVLKIQS